MEFQFDQNAAFTVACALAAGMAGQSLAHHARLPGIVVLLALGGLLGPDGLNLVQPAALGDGLHGLVGFAVAVILFEGGMSLDVRRLRRAGRAIRQLISVGAIASLAIGAVVAWRLLGWEWEQSLLFGTLVVVTGPTVVTPLLRRLHVKRHVSTVLEAEGVLIDAVGAITAAVALELVVRPTADSFTLAAPMILGRLAFGVVLGLVGGGLLALLLRFRNVVPEGLENPFSLAWAVIVFQIANAVMPETGIAAVTVAGFVVGNTRSHASSELQEFKEQLTVMLIGMLFVLLVADVRLADVLALGWPGVAVTVATIFIVRPLSVWLGTLGTSLARNERLFIAWIGPRGIVAAAVASFFAYELEEAGIDGGQDLRALVFLVIAVTVLWSALTGSAVARFLELKRPSDDGWVILGANALARRLGRALSDVGVEVVLIDHDERKVAACEAEGMVAVHGNALESRSAELARVDTRVGAVALTTNEEVNFLFAEKTRLRLRSLRFPIGIKSWNQGVTAEMVRHIGCELLFAANVDAPWWETHIENGDTEMTWWQLAPGHKHPDPSTGDDPSPPYLPLVHVRLGVAEPFTHRSRLGPGSRLAVLIDRTRAPEAERALQAVGLVPATLEPMASAALRSV